MRPIILLDDVFEKLDARGCISCWKGFVHREMVSSLLQTRMRRIRDHLENYLDAIIG